MKKRPRPTHFLTNACIKMHFVAGFIKYRKAWSSSSSAQARKLLDWIDCSSVDCKDTDFTENLINRIAFKADFAKYWNNGCKLIRETSVRTSISFKVFQLNPVITDNTFSLKKIFTKLSNQFERWRRAKVNYSFIRQPDLIRCRLDGQQGWSDPLNACFNVKFYSKRFPEKGN